MIGRESVPDGNILQMKTPTQVNQEAAVLVLGNLLQLAKEGRMAAVAVAYVRADRLSTSQAWSSCDCVPALIGAAATLQQQLILSAVTIATEKGPKP